MINFVVSNTVEAGATATATNNNQDNDNISNTATNAGGRKRRKKRSWLKSINHSSSIDREIGRYMHDNFISFIAYLQISDIFPAFKY